MKRMIISPAQLKMINEDVATYDGTAPGLNKAVADFRATGNNTGGSVSFVNENPPLDAPNNAFTGDINVASGSNTVTMTSNDINKLEESRFSKRQVELGRMLEMRKNGKVFSKKQLNEMFMETDIAEKIKDCPAFDVMTTFGSVFGDDAEREMMDLFSAGGNPIDFIVSVYNEASEEDQNLFREKLGI
jgi:hypothetical protein